MGLLDKLFGTDTHQPALDPTSAGAARIEKSRSVLEAFAKKIHDKMEIVPGERAVYIFIGHPRIDSGSPGSRAPRSTT